MKSHTKLLSLVICLALSSCATNTVARRVDRNAGKFSSLSPEQQSLVEQGRIAKGMSRDGVFLALGKPDRVNYGASKKGGEFVELSLTPTCYVE